MGKKLTSSDDGTNFETKVTTRIFIQKKEKKEKNKGIFIFQVLASI